MPSISNGFLTSWNMPLKLSRSSLGLKRFTSRIAMENEKPNNTNGKSNDVIRETFINHIKFSQSINRLREHLISIMKLGNSSDLNNTTKNNRPFNIAVFTNCFNNDDTNDQNTIQIVKECLRQRMKGVLNRRGYTIVTAQEAQTGSTPLMTKNDATHHRWYNFNSSRNIILFGVGTENGDILKITNLMDNGKTGTNAYQNFGLFSDTDKLHHKNFGFGGNVGDSLLSLIHSPFKYTVYLNSNISVFSSKLKQIFFILASQKSGLACVRTNQKDFLKSENNEYLVDNRNWIANTNGYRTDIIGLDKSNKYALPLLDNVRTNYVRHVRTWYRYLNAITDKTTPTHLATQASMKANYSNNPPDRTDKTFADLYVDAYYNYSWKLIKEMNNLNVKTFNKEIDAKGSSHSINYQNYHSVIIDTSKNFQIYPSLAEDTNENAEADGYHYLINNASKAGNITYSATSPMLAHGLEPISADNVPPRGWVSAISLGYNFQTGSSTSDGYDYFGKDTDQGKAMRNNYVMNDFPYDNVRGQQVLYNALHPFRSTTGAFESSHGGSGDIFNNNYHHQDFTGMSEQNNETGGTLDSTSSKYVFELPNYTFIDQQDFLYTNTLVSELISKSKDDIKSNHTFTSKTHQLSQSIHIIKQKSGSEDNKPIEKIDILFQETNDDLRDVNDPSNITGGGDSGGQSGNNSDQTGADSTNGTSSGGTGGGSNGPRSKFQAQNAAILAENVLKYETFINNLVATSSPTLEDDALLTDPRVIDKAKDLFKLSGNALDTDGLNDKAFSLTVYKEAYQVETETLTSTT